MREPRVVLRLFGTFEVHVKNVSDLNPLYCILHPPATTCPESSHSSSYWSNEIIAQFFIVKAFVFGVVDRARKRSWKVHFAGCGMLPHDTCLSSAKRDNLFPNRFGIWFQQNYCNGLQMAGPKQSPRNGYTKTPRLVDFFILILAAGSQFSFSSNPLSSPYTSYYSSYLIIHRSNRRFASKLPQIYILSMMSATTLSIS